MEKNSDRIRCFIAIDIPREVINEVERVQQELKKKNLFYGKLTEGENLHLTLKFLGEMSEEKLNKTKKRLAEIKFEKFSAKIGDLGVFNSDFIRIIWIRLLGKGIFSLQKQIDDKLTDFFEKEERFMGH